MGGNEGGGQRGKGKEKKGDYSISFRSPAFLWGGGVVKSARYGGAEKRGKRGGGMVLLSLVPFRAAWWGEGKGGSVVSAVPKKRGKGPSTLTFFRQEKGKGNVAQMFKRRDTEGKRKKKERSSACISSTRGESREAIDAYKEKEKGNGIGSAGKKEMKKEKERRSLFQILGTREERGRRGRSFEEMEGRVEDEEGEELGHHASSPEEKKKGAGSYSARTSGGKSQQKQKKKSNF